MLTACDSLMSLNLIRKSMLILWGFERMKEWRWNMWKSMAETEWKSDVIFHWKQGAQKKRKERKMHPRKFKVCSRIFSPCFRTFGFFLSFFSLTFFFFSSLWPHPIRSGLLTVRDEDGPLAEVLSTRSNLFSYWLWLSAPSAPCRSDSSWISSALPPGLWPLPPLRPLRKDSCCGCWKLTERRGTDSPRSPVDI